jgi:riboflavin kinase/FMN adenylyltransferase
VIPERVNFLHEVMPSNRPTALAVGVFDGVHRGHQALLGQLLASARADGLRPAVLTFFPHPRSVIDEAPGRFYLTTLEERVALLAGLGFELIITHPFDAAVRQTRAADFVAQMVRHLNLRQLWGGNFSLGYQREGTLDFLVGKGVQHGFTVHQVGREVTGDNRPISSSRIRAALAAGDMVDVTRCLGRRYGAWGEVVIGRKLGRTLGFPTANIEVWGQQQLPANGVYATRVRVGEVWWPAATNVGIRPTVDGTRFAVEAHLSGFSGELYGERVWLEFVARVRPEQRFDGLEALKAQIARDIETVRTLLGEGW